MVYAKDLIVPEDSKRHKHDGLKNWMEKKKKSNSETRAKESQKVSYKFQIIF